MYRKNIQLQQHTPLIHFQQDQAGATLRATSLKPLLNRFIIEHAENLRDLIPYKQEIYDLFKQTVDEKTASPYRLRVVPPTNPNWQYYFCTSAAMGKDDLPKLKRDLEEQLKRTITIVEGTAFFANQTTFQSGAIKEGELENIRLAVFTDSPFEVQLSAFDTQIRAFVSAYLHPFFLLTNFGTRSTKGFGCFESTPAEAVSYNMTDLLKAIPDVVSAHYDELNYRNPTTDKLTTTATIYRKIKCETTLKDGKWVPNSAAQDYLEEQEPKKYWEKYGIAQKMVYDKQDFKDRYGNEIKADDILFVRGILGLTDNYDYRNKGKKIVVKDAKAEVDRFPSPILIKFAEGKTWVIGREIPKTMLGRTFHFVLDGDKGKAFDKVADRKKIALTTPPNFDLGKFLDFALTQRVSSTWTHVK